MLWYAEFLKRFANLLGFKRDISDQLNGNENSDAFNEVHA